MRTYYTAIGNFRRRQDGEGRSYPIISINHKEYPVDMQEMALWSILSWQMLSYSQIEEKYDRLSEELPPMEQRTMSMCLTRLRMRGLVAAGNGKTDFEAIYDLISGLYIVPISESISLRLITFLKMVLLDGVPVSRARQLFRRDRPSRQEAQVIALSKQALLSTAELIKCAETGVTDVSTGDKLMEALYNDDTTTSDNIIYEMLNAEQREPVTMAVANLYLRKQIIFERL